MAHSGLPMTTNWAGLAPLALSRIIPTAVFWRAASLLAPMGHFGISIFSATTLADELWAAPSRSIPSLGPRAMAALPVQASPLDLTVRCGSHGARLQSRSDESTPPVT